MNNLVERIFTIAINERTSKAIYGVWRRKALYFNLLSFLSLTLGLLVTFVFQPRLINAFLVPFILVYFVLLNIFYSLNSFVLVIANKALKDSFNISAFATILYITLCFFAALIPFSLCVLDLIINAT